MKSAPASTCASKNRSREMAHDKMAATQVETNLLQTKHHDKTTGLHVESLFSDSVQDEGFRKCQ